MTDGEEDEQVEVELDDGDTEQPKPALPSEDGDKDEGDEAEQPGDVNDELVVEVEGLDGVNIEDAAADETPLQRKLRHMLRDEKREKLELRRENDALKAAQAPKPVEVGPEPDLWEDCDGDPDRYKVALLKWDKDKATADQQQRSQEDARQTAARRVQQATETVRSNAVKAGIRDFDVAEQAVRGTLSPALAEAIVLLMPDDAPLLVKALHAHPQLLEEVNKAVTDDPQLGLAAGLVRLTKLTARLKMVPKRKTSVQPEEIVRGSAPLSVVPADKKEAQLRAAVDADKPGAQDAYLAYLKAQRKAQRAA